MSRPRSPGCLLCPLLRIRRRLPCVPLGVRRRLLCPLIGVRWLLQLQPLYIKLRSPSSFDGFTFAWILAESFIVNTVATGLSTPVSLLHGLAFCFRLQARLARPPLARRRNSRWLNRFLRYLFAQVRTYVAHLRYIARLRRHHQWRPLNRAPSHIYAGPSLARRLYSCGLSRFCCQRQRRPLTRNPSHTCCGKQSLEWVEVEKKLLEQLTTKHLWLIWNFPCIELFNHLAYMLFEWPTGS